MLTGRRAFDGETISDTIAAILEREPDWTRLPAATPPPLVRLLRRALDKDLRRRLRDIGDARAELDNITGDVTAPSPAGTSPRLSAWTVAAVFAMIAAAAGFLAGARRGARQDDAPSVSRLVRLTTGPALESGPAISPDGKWVAYLSNARGLTDVWVKFVAGGDPINLTASANLEVQTQVDIAGLAISPDGASIAFDAMTKGDSLASRPFSSWVIPAPLGGVPRKFLEGGRGVRWSPDGTKVVYIAPGSTAGDALWTADADGTNRKEIAPRRGGMHKHWPAWSHDSRYIYFIYTITTTTTNGEPSEIYRVAASGGPMEPVVSTSRRAVFPALLPDGRGLIYAANPVTAELGLWWRSLDRASTDARRLTIGLGEYAELAMSSTGQSVVSTLIDYRRSLVKLPARAGVSEDQVDDDHGWIDGRPRSRAVDARNADGLQLDARRQPQPVDVESRWHRCEAADVRHRHRRTAGDFAGRPAGRICVGSRWGRGIWLIAADGGSPRSLAPVDVLDGLSWSPDGRSIAYAAPGDGAPGLWIVDCGGGTVLDCRPARSGSRMVAERRRHRLRLRVFRSGPTGQSTSLWRSWTGMANHSPSTSPMISYLKMAPLPGIRTGRYLASTGNSGRSPASSGWWNRILRARPRR